MAEDRDNQLSCNNIIAHGNAESFEDDDYKKFIDAMMKRLNLESIKEKSIHRIGQSGKSGPT